MVTQQTDNQPASPTWHPLARLNLWIVLGFGVFEIGAALVLLFLPGTIDGSMIDLLTILGAAWWFGIIFCMFWVASNAIWLSWSLYGKRQTNPFSWRNLLVGWSAPVIFSILMLTWVPVVETITEYRLDKEFHSARPDMLEICDQILAEGIESAALHDYKQIGDYTNINISAHDTAVYFERNGIGRTFGYVCVAQDTTLPSQDDIFEYDNIDARFYYFAEID